jgi:voltage-gated potassium channel
MDKMIFHNNLKTGRLLKRLRIQTISLITSPVFIISIFILSSIFIASYLILIFEDKNNTGINNIFDALWLILVTITTTGYGDIFPQTPAGRIVGVYLMAFGVIVIASVSGRIASYLVDQRLKKERGLIRLKHAKDHYIICGFRHDYPVIIKGILKANPEFDISDFVIINNQKDYMETFLSDPENRLINYICGDFIEESVLLRANIKDAARVLILSEDIDGYSRLETDSRTIMSVLTIKNLTKKIYVTAELMDEKFSRYLEVADCDEIILTKDYERKLIINASSGTGLSNVILDLLDYGNERGLFIKDIPDRFIGLTYRNLFDDLLSANIVLIGLLENTGNFYSRKLEALGEAQKNPNLSVIVQNLKKIKELKANTSILVPEFNYEIKKYTKAIVIGKPNE